MVQFDQKSCRQLGLRTRSGFRNPYLRSEMIRSLPRRCDQDLPRTSLGEPQDLLQIQDGSSNHAHSKPTAFTARLCAGTSCILQHKPFFSESASRLARYTPLSPRGSLVAAADRPAVKQRCSSSQPCRQKAKSDYHRKSLLRDHVRGRSSDSVSIKLPPPMATIPIPAQSGASNV